MKKVLSLIMSFCLLMPVCFLFGCNNEENYRITVVTTVFSEYDWVKNIVGDTDDVGVSMLLDGGADLHSYQPSFADIRAIRKCDLFIYVGGESDKWVDDALKQSENENRLVINLMEVLGENAREEEQVEGMQEEEHNGDEEGETEYDEHVWLSIKNAKLFVKVIKEKLCLIDAENSRKYELNSEKYINELDALDGEYRQVVSEKNKDTLLFADRFPFLYLVKDYGLKYYAAFKGCSANSEATPKTYIFLANKVDELSLSVILKIESSDGKTAQAVKNNTVNKDQTILTMDSLQSATIKEYENGRTYINAMKANLDVLKEALK